MDASLISVLKPHYIDRYDHSSRSPIDKHECSHQNAKDIQKIEYQVQTDHIHLMFAEKVQKVQQFKLALAQMIREMKQNWILILSQKQTFINQMNKQHQQKMKSIFSQIDIIKKKIYEEFKHVCTSKKDSSCHICRNRDLFFNEKILKFLKGDQHKQVLKEGKKDKNKNIVQKKPFLKRKQKENHEKSKKERKKKNSVQISPVKEEKQSRNQIQKQKSMATEQRNNSRQNLLDFFKESKNKQSFERRTVSKLKSFANLNSQIDKSFDDFQGRGKTRRLTGMNSLHRNLKTEFFSEKPLQQTSPEPFDWKNQSRKSSRKSILKLSQDLSSFNNNIRSRFFESPQPDVKPRNTLEASGKTNKTTKRVRVEFKNEKSNEPVQKQIHSRKPAKKVKTIKVTRQITNQDLLIDLSDSQSQPQKQKPKQEPKKSVEKPPLRKEKALPFAESKTEIQRPQKSRLSRYQRQKLFYSVLKRELVKTNLPKSKEFAEAIEQQKSEYEPQSLVLDKSDKSVPSKYCANQRKESLLTKLKIFNQSVDFQDVKGQVQNFLQKKNEFILQNAGKQVLVSELVDNKEERPNKIIQMFLGDVLKIADLKRLLKKKFSEQLYWGQRMREMHQFYTYLQFSLQKFRVNSVQILDENWKNLSFQNKQIQTLVDDFEIDQTLGHYQGIQGIGLTEFEHHRQIQCSMKYYGIQIKREQETPEFIFNQPVAMEQDDQNSIGQKSLRSIREQLSEENQSFNSILQLEGS